MTLPASPNSIAISEVNTEVGRTATTANTPLQWLNDTYVRSDQRPASANLGTFRGMAFYQRNQDGNCTNNGFNCDTNCNCDCGNIQCNACVNCATVNCANCDTQNWLQANCNCACTYNCHSQTNCFSYNCNCSKIICTKLHELGLMDSIIFQADQLFGIKMLNEEPEVHAGYTRWASTIVAGMEGKTRDFMYWVPKSIRKDVEAKSTIKWALKVATPWSKHMAYEMGMLSEDDNVGRLIMKMGKKLSKFVNKLPKAENSLLGIYTLWLVCPVMYYAAVGIDKCQSVCNFNKVTVNG